MGACHNEFRKRNSSNKNRRKTTSFEKGSFSTQSYDKLRRNNSNKTPNMGIGYNNNQDKNSFIEKEIFYNDSNKNDISKLDTMSKADQKSNKSETNFITQNNNNIRNNEKNNKEIYFNKNSKNLKINTKIALEYNLHTNNFGKQNNETPIKIMKSFDNFSIDNELKEKEKLINLDKKNNIQNKCVYVIDDEPENLSNVKKLYSNELDYYKNIKINLNDLNKLSYDILSLPERKWYNELIDLNELLIKTREKLDMNVFISYISKIIKIYESFNWLIDSISTFYINLKYKNIQYNNIANIGLPEINSEKWNKGFKWKGVYININEGNNNKTIINEIKALNYFFFDYLQIIDKFQFIKNNQLSNEIIFPLIGYSNINGKILTVSALINVDNNNEEYISNIIKKNNGIINLYSNIKNKININYNDLNINKNNEYLINSMGKDFYINDLLISKLFYNLNDSHFIKIKKDKYIIFNLYKLIPDLFSINFDFIKKLNFFSKIKNKPIFYSLNYDIINKINIHQKLSKYKNPKDTLENLYYMNHFSSIKSKDIIINNIYFRILYEKDLQNLDDLKNNIPFSNNFVDNLFNYNYENRNISIKTKIKEPYTIIYDLIEPIKIKYSLIKSNKNYVFSKEENINKVNRYNIDNTNIEQEKPNKISKNIFYIESNYLSFFMSWCKSLSQNSFNIKTYSDLKQCMKKYGINSIMRFFSLVIIDNPEITDIIKISLLIKGIKFAFNKEINNNNLNYNEEGLKYILIKYIKSILYPNEILPKEQTHFDNIFKELVFYSNLLFLKLKLIDYYLNLELLSLNDIKDQNICVNISFNVLKEEKIKEISKKLSGFNSPDDFLIHIISIARKKPFLFLSELEQKLNFIINPYIKFKSSLSIESMSNQLETNHISLNYNDKTFSYIKSTEISGLILTKIITKYKIYDWDETNQFNKIYILENELRNDNNEIANKVGEYDDYSTYNNGKTSKGTSFPPSVGDTIPTLPDIFLTEHNINMNKTCEENITINSEISKEYTTDNNQSIYSNNVNNTQNNNYYNISEINSNQKNILKNNLDKNNSDRNKTNLEWDNIKNEFLIDLPSICYKMNYISKDIEKNQNKLKNLTLYKNLSNIYNIMDPKIIIEWGEIIEDLFNNLYSCNGDIEHSILYSLFYLFIYYFYFTKKRNESYKISKKIINLYQFRSYKLSLNDLIVINLFQALLNNDYIKSEENFSKTIMLIFFTYGEPRGRNNDSHGILEFPIWKLCRKTLKFEQITTSENFREMFHTLDYFEWKKSLLREKYKLYEVNDIINYSVNAVNNLDEILLINNIDKNDFKNIENKINDNNTEHKKLCEKIFGEKILELKIIKHFNFPKLTDFNDKVNNIFENKEFILYIMKQMKSLFIGKKILFNKNYINNEISKEIFNPDKDINNFQNILIKFNNTKNNNYKNNINFKNCNDFINKNDNYRYNGIIKNHLNNRDYSPFISNIRNSINNKYNILDKNSKQLNRHASGSNIKSSNTNIFSHFLYNELLDKLSYNQNMPSGVVFSFGNNRHCETSHDNIVKLTLPRIIFKFKNEYANKIYSGWEHNIIINNQGEIFTFGYNKNFQCGLPNIDGKNDKINNPTNISIINDNFKAISASCGNEHSLILKNDNSVYAFGNNEDGELGLKNRAIKTYKFNKINFGKYSNQITQISAGTVHNLALTKDGRVFAWGSSQGGQLGLSEEYLLNKPGFKENLFLYEPTIIHINKNLKKNIKNFQENINNSNNHVEIEENDDDFIIKISCGEAHSMALSSKGDVYSWGYGSNGQLGLGFCEDSFEPGLSANLSRKFTPQYIKYFQNEKIIDIQCGKTFTMFINDSKEIFGCGVNDLSQLGINEHFHKRKNENICYDIVWPSRLDYLMNKKVQKLSCGEGHCLAIINYPENVCSVWSWGNNKFGQLGHGSWIDKSMPKPINYLLGFNNDKFQFEEISCGGFHSMCLVKYKEDLSWIEDDFKKIVNSIKSNDNKKYIISNLNSPNGDIKSEKIGHINIFKYT